MNKIEMLEAYGSGPVKLYGKMKDITAELLNFRPDLEDAWTIREHLIHLVDTEINGFVRLKAIIAQPGSSCFVMDETNWTKNLRRKNEDVQKYLTLFKLLREMAHDLLVDEDEVNWNRDYVTREREGSAVQITIEKWVEIYTNHLNAHLDFVDRNIQEFHKASK
jgi:hypothetical protein